MKVRKKEYEKVRFHSGNTKAKANFTLPRAPLPLPSPSPFPLPPPPPLCISCAPSIPPAHPPRVAQAFSSPRALPPDSSGQIQGSGRTALLGGVDFDDLRFCLK